MFNMLYTNLKYFLYMFIIKHIKYFFTYSFYILQFHFFLMFLIDVKLKIYSYLKHLQCHIHTFHFYLKLIIFLTLVVSPNILKNSAKLLNKSSSFNICFFSTFYYFLMYCITITNEFVSRHTISSLVLLYASIVECLLNFEYIIVECIFNCQWFLIEISNNFNTIKKNQNY